MVVTRSQQGEERPEAVPPRSAPTERAQVEQGAVENMPRLPPVLDAFLSSSSAAAAAAAARRVSPHEESTTGMSTEEEERSTRARRNDSARSSTVRPGGARSVRSAASRKRLLAELKAKERLAELQIKKAQAEEELQKLRLQRLQIEEDEEESSEEEEREDELESVRIQEWIKRTPLKEKETAQPPPEEEKKKEEAAAAPAAENEVQQRGNMKRHDNTEETRRASDVFEHAYSAGLHPDDILDAIGSMRENPGVAELIRTLAESGWHVLLLTDANTVFVHHWLKVHGLEESVTQVITNRAFWKSGRLYIEPCMRQTACSRCPTNLCKSIALAQFIAQRSPYSRIVYAGDGRNDFCPATNLPPHAIVFPRRGYPLDDLIKKTLASPSPLVQAKVVPFQDGYTIIKELFPEKSLIA